MLWASSSLASYRHSVQELANPEREEESECTGGLETGLELGAYACVGG